MPVIGLTDDLTPRFPRLGKLRKGGERVEKTNKDGKKYTTFGDDLPYFRFTGNTPEITAAFYAHNDVEPHELRCYLAYPTPDEAFPVWAELWGATGLVHRCDGKNMTVWFENSKYSTGTKPCPGGHKDGDPSRDAIGRLHLILPELLIAGHVGYVTLETHSKNDIINILQVLMETYRKALAGGGDLTGIEFILRRTKESISTPGFGSQAGKRSRVDKFLVKIEPAAEWVRAQLEAAHEVRMALPAGQLKADPETGELIESDDVIDGESWDSTPPPPEDPPAEQPKQEPKKASPPPAQPATPPGNGERPANSKPTPEDWGKLAVLADEAEQLGITTSSLMPPTGATLGALRSSYKNINNLVKAKKAQPAQATA